MEREERRGTLLLRSSGMHFHDYRILAELTWVGRCGSLTPGGLVTPTASICNLRYTINSELQ